MRISPSFLDFHYRFFSSFLSYFLSIFLTFSLPLTLVSINQAKATVKRDGVWSNIDAAEVVPGDLVLLACGSAIPADSRINEGQIEVDQAALTGESLPVTMYKVFFSII